MGTTFRNLAYLSIIASAITYIMDNIDKTDKDILGLGEGQKMGQLIGTTNSMNNTTYYIDTDNNLKTVEYISTIRAGSYAEAQMSAQLFNAKGSINQIPLKKWREFSDTFQAVKERF